MVETQTMTRVDKPSQIRFSTIVCLLVCLPCASVMHGGAFAADERTVGVFVALCDNGLMDFALALPTGETIHKETPECIVLCCKSQSYFRKRIAALRARPVLLTTQFMYPGAFILHAVLDDWLKDSGLKACRTAAGRAYAANQGISLKAAVGVFADLEQVVP